MPGRGRAGAVPSTACNDHDAELDDELGTCQLPQVTPPASRSRAGRRCRRPRAVEVGELGVHAGAESAQSISIVALGSTVSFAVGPRLRHVRVRGHDNQTVQAPPT